MNSRTSTELPVIRADNDTYSTFDKVQDIIRERALCIFHDRNPNEGDALSDWLNAETEVLTEIDLGLADNDCNVTIDGSVEGFIPDEIEVRVRDGLLEVAGIHAEKSSRTENTLTRPSSKQMCFFRSFNLPDSLDTSNIKVSHECGKFTVRIAKVFH
jgi:HSP20 family molecular chaperone IbpA